MTSVLGDPFRPVRRSTRVVRVGEIEIGGENPIRIQSMTNTDTMDTAGTVAQTIRLAEAGCEIVRVTAPSIREAENLREIRRELKAHSIDVPLVADIHFTPNAALVAANLVEKVRINPGNYADKKRFEVREYDDREYEGEIARVRDRFVPLARRCKENGVAMRIGTNHGSLSDRILNRYGDTPEGMVESALEFLDVCEGEGYRDIVFSMKASNTQVAIQAYRFLATRLEEREPGQASYPFHVGVTEAGDSEDGRIKSAIGIGSLLEDGIGDTIRVSLTEDPVREVPVARAIAERAERVRGLAPARDTPIRVTAPPVRDPLAHARRVSGTQAWGDLEIGGDAPVGVEIHLADALNEPIVTAARLALELSDLRDVRAESLLVDVEMKDAAERAVSLQSELASLGEELPVSLRLDLRNGDALGALGESGHGIARWVGCVDAETEGDRLEALVQMGSNHSTPIEFELAGRADEIPDLVGRVVAAWSAAGAAAKTVPPSFSLAVDATVHSNRVLVSALADLGSENPAAGAPIVLRQRLLANSPAAESAGPAAIPEGLIGTNPVSEVSLLDASVRLGALLCDGIGDAISLTIDGVGAASAVDVGYRVLQGARQRTTRTEYISCPSCGRTLFDLEETTARIKAKTDHLRGVKIAVMGCIVNGPGEMADADFGYVGSGVGQVTLYVGKEVVARAVPEAEATDRLVDLIRDHGQWVEFEESPAVAIRD